MNKNLYELRLAAHKRKWALKRKRNIVGKLMNCLPWIIGGIIFAVITFWNVMRFQGIDPYPKTWMNAVSCITGFVLAYLLANAVGKSVMNRLRLKWLDLSVKIIDVRIELERLIE